MNTQPSAELLPCPFCGQNPMVKDEGVPRIYCSGDECLGPRTTAFTLQDATVQWNCRMFTLAARTRPGDWSMSQDKATIAQTAQVIIDGLQEELKQARIFVEQEKAWRQDKERLLQNSEAYAAQLRAQVERAELRLKDAHSALRSIAEGNLGDASWQANYDTVKLVARNALSSTEDQRG